MNFADTTIVQNEANGSVEVCLEKDRETAKEFSVAIVAQSQGITVLNECVHNLNNYCNAVLMDCFNCFYTWQYVVHTSNCHAVLVPFLKQFYSSFFCLFIFFFFRQSCHCLSECGIPCWHREQSVC